VAFARSDLDLTDRVIQLANGAAGSPGPSAGSGATPPKTPPPAGSTKP
jgi:hypothetical protein